jgi:hypothetical protein
MSGFFFGSWYAKKMQPDIPPCPACPPAAIVELQRFQMDKAKNIREFTYSPQMHNVSIRIDAQDTALVNAIAKRISK